MSWDATAANAGAPSRIVVAADPPHPSNVLRVHYSVDGGAERVARGFPLAGATGAAPQHFAVDLPALPTGSVARWRPVLSCSGREADPRRGGVPAETLGPVEPAPTAAGSKPQAARPERFPHSLQFLARVTAPLEHHPRVVGETPEGLRIVYPIDKGGTIRGPRFNGDIEHAGGDWLLVRPDGVGVPEIRVLIRTDDGAVVMGEYGGIIDFGPDGFAALSRNRPPARAWTQLTPRYVTAAPALQWLNRVQCVAFGWVTMATLLVEYDLYALRPGSAATMPGAADAG